MSDVGKGYVSIHREIMDHWIWQDKPVSKGQAWVDLILLANYKNEKFSYKDKVVEGKRGSVYRSITYLAERWGWGRDKATRFLHQLETDGMIKLEATTHQTTISIVNYEDYQGLTSTVGATNRQQVGSKAEVSRQQVVNRSAHTIKGIILITTIKGIIPVVRQELLQMVRPLKRLKKQIAGLKVCRREPNVWQCMNLILMMRNALQCRSAFR